MGKMWTKIFISHVRVSLLIIFAFFQNFVSHYFSTFCKKFASNKRKLFRLNHSLKSTKLSNSQYFTRLNFFLLIDMTHLFTLNLMYLFQIFSPIFQSSSFLWCLLISYNSIEMQGDWWICKTAKPPDNFKKNWRKVVRILQFLSVR